MHKGKAVLIWVFDHIIGAVYYVGVIATYLTLIIFTLFVWGFSLFPRAWRWIIRKMEENSNGRDNN